MQHPSEIIVRFARHYLGVPFAHQGRSRAGLDCLGLLVCVARDAGLRVGGRLAADFDETNYAHLPDEKRLYCGLARVLYEVETGRMQTGDVALMRIDGAVRHLGIIAEYPAGGFSLIHAYAPARKVVEHRLDADWRAKIIHIFRF